MAPFIAILVSLLIRKAQRRRRQNACDDDDVMMMMMMNFIHVSMYLADANWGHECDKCV